jgi:hypothetical protein
VLRERPISAYVDFLLDVGQWPKWGHEDAFPRQG